MADNTLTEYPLKLSDIGIALWSVNYIIDRLKQQLATVRYILRNAEGESVEGRKYYNQAYQMQIAGALKPTPSFLVYLSDLTPKLVKELSNLDNETRGYVLRQAVGRIFEDLNPKLYHDSISRVLVVKLEG
jgi:hypothetical protein